MKTEQWNVSSKKIAYRRLFGLWFCCCADLLVVGNAVDLYQDCLPRWSSNYGCYHGNHLFQPILRTKEEKIFDKIF